MTQLLNIDGAPWASAIPVVSEVPENYGDLRPHVLLRGGAHGEANFDIALGPHQAVDPQANYCVAIPRIGNDPSANLSEDWVALHDTFNDRMPWEVDLNPFFDFLAQEEISAGWFPADVAEELEAAGVLDVEPKDVELHLDKFYFEVTAQGIVLASLRTVVAQHYARSRPGGH